MNESNPTMSYFKPEIGFLQMFFFTSIMQRFAKKARPLGQMSGAARNPGGRAACKGGCGALFGLVYSAGTRVGTRVGVWVLSIMAPRFKHWITHARLDTACVAYKLLSKRRAIESRPACSCNSRARFS